MQYNKLRGYKYVNLFKAGEIMRDSVLAKA